MNAPRSMNDLRGRWAALGARERTLVAVAVVLIGAALLWAVAVQPALRTLRSAPQEQARLDAQWQAMQREAAEATRLRAAPPLAQGLAVQALQGATDRMGPAGRLSLQGDRAVLTLTNATPEAVQQWLAEARRGARARPVEARLSASEQGFSGTLTVTMGGGS